MDETTPVTAMSMSDLLARVHLHAHRAEELHEQLVVAATEAEVEEIGRDLLRVIAAGQDAFTLALLPAHRDVADLRDAARGDYSPVDFADHGDLLAGESDWLSSAEDRQGAVWYPFTTEEGL